MRSATINHRYYRNYFESLAQIVLLAFCVCYTPNVLFPICFDTIIGSELYHRLSELSALSRVFLQAAFPDKSLINAVQKAGQNRRATIRKTCTTKMNSCCISTKI